MKNFVVVTLPALAILVASPSFATKPLQNYYQEGVASTCLLNAKVRLDEKLVYQCMVQNHNVIKAQINARLTGLSAKDKVHVLNTRGLDFEMLKFDCSQAYVQPVLVKSCMIQADSSYLSYLLQRYP